MFFRLSHLTITVFTDFPKVSAFSTRGTHAYILLLSLRHSPNSQIMFSGFLTVPFLQDFGDNTQTFFKAFRFHQWDSNQTILGSPCRKWGLLVSSLPRQQRANHSAFPIEHRSP